MASKFSYFKRQIEPVLNQTLKTFSSVALTGPRQTGKSTLLHHFLGKSYKYISFDNPAIRQKAISDPELFLDEAGDYVVFDEVQYVPELMSYLKIRIDKDRGKKGKYVLTGSQQFHLIRNLSDTLAGRIALLNLLPFSLEEISPKKKLAPVKSFENFCLRGAFPELQVNKMLDGELWYGSYFQTYLERDVHSVFNIGSLREFSQFMHLLASRCSQILHLSDFANDLGMSVNTIKSWLSVLEASQLIYILQPHFNNYGKRIRKSPKVYFTDAGMVCYLTGIKTKEMLMQGPLAGALFENFIIQETLKKIYYHGKRPELYYLRTGSGLEVDLIIKKDTKLIPYEIKLTRTPAPGMGKNLEQFMKSFEKLKPEKGRIICLADEAFEISRNVRAIPIDAYLNEIV